MPYLDATITASLSLTTGVVPFRFIPISTIGGAGILT